MKRMLLWVLVLLQALVPFSAFAENIYQDAAESLFAAITNGQELQQWLDETVAPSAGGTADNYAMILSRHQADADFTAYIQAAASMLQPDGIDNPVSRQRCALSVIACDAPDLVPEALADETIGKLGVMSYVYGLHLLNNGATSSLWTVEAVLEKLLEMQKHDGGWAVMGQYGDVDVTAMCLQALACNRGNNPRISESISRALAFLSEKQLENGGFVGSGHENAESSAQVILALASLEIDACSDARFIKNGVSVMDALMQYSLPDGGFAHFPGDTAANDTANQQALQALCAYLRSGERFFDFTEIGETEYTEKSARSWKFWALAAIGVLTAAGILFALTRKRGRAKQLIFVLAVAAIAVAAVLMINVESTADYYSVSLPTGDELAGQAYISIRCDTVRPEDGVILERTTIPFRAGDSVFDVLTTATRLFKIQMEHEGGEGGMAYVSGIDYLYEYTHGDLSGWIYSVNGETLSIGCGSRTVQDGDEILWQYTTQLGEDLK